VYLPSIAGKYLLGNSYLQFDRLIAPMTSFKVDKWVLSARAGEDQAWNVLYHRYYPQLYAIALSICGDSSETKDLVQDSFITAWIKLAQLKNPVTFGPWLRTILTRNCYQWLNKKKLKNHSHTFLFQQESFEEPDFEQKLDELSKETRLFTALAGLPDTLRSALLLRYFSSYQSYDEISMILAVPVGTVRSRLNEAKSRLSDKWKRAGDLDAAILKESKEWNNFYYESYSGIHRHEDDKNRFLKHLGQSVRISLPNGQQSVGSALFEKLIRDDLTAGSYLAPANVITSANISIVEVKHYNSTENPDHCPPRSVSVLVREGAGVSKMNLHLSWL